MTFSQLGLNDFLLQSLTENKIDSPTEIQQKVIPFVLTNRKNLVAVSQTGTGKTAAFGLPILQLIDPKLMQTQVLVIVPTRELAQQVAKDLFVFSRYIVRIHTEAVFGGKKIEEQIKKLETPKHIIVATPGRLVDLMNRKIVDLSHLKFLVLDEADEMLRMGFKADVERVLRACKPSVRKFMFTSTMPDEIKQIARQYLGEGVDEIQVKPQEFVNRNIQHSYIAYAFGYKFEFLKSYLLQHPEERGIIFCRTQAAAKLLRQQLIGCDINAGALYGDLNQFERDKVMSAFKGKRISLLIATDIAARGIDVADLNFVIHYHLAENEAQYINRSGRTGRAGKKGLSISMVQDDELFHVKEIEDILRIQFSEEKLKVTIDKTSSIEIELKINIGTRHELSIASFKEFLLEFAGLKEDAIRDVKLYRAETTFVLDSRYENQLMKNINNGKFFHQRVTIEKL
ncbi:MAG: DEAD/DEAH box helicase [Bacteroidetes bacterium]|nr:DEAD/DEAH box helicase [Bacteroidota bacterium]